jgi:hypothetical protein
MERLPTRWISDNSEASMSPRFSKSNATGRLLTVAVFRACTRETPSLADPDGMSRCLTKLPRICTYLLCLAGAGLVAFGCTPNSTQSANVPARLARPPAAVQAGSGPVACRVKERGAVPAAVWPSARGREGRNGPPTKFSRPGQPTALGSGVSGPGEWYDCHLVT